MSALEQAARDLEKKTARLMHVGCEAGAPLSEKWGGEWRTLVADVRDLQRAHRAALDAGQAQPVAWVRAIDEAMVTHHIGTAEPSDDYETAKRKLNSLLCHAQSIGEYFAKQATLDAGQAQPVAWYYVEDPWGANEWHWMTDSPESQGCDPRDWTPVYASPPARQPLTDEQIMDLPAGVNDGNLSFLLRFVRAIERAHGIT